MAGEIEVASDDDVDDEYGKPSSKVRPKRKRRTIDENLSEAELEESDSE